MDANGSSTQDQIARARSAVQQGRHDIAERLAVDRLKRTPEDLDALEILAMCQQVRGDRAAAERSLVRAIALAPHKRWPRDDLARLLLAQGRAAEAERVARAALAQDADDANAHAVLGVLLSERENLPGGAAHLRRAIELTGRHPQLLANLGRNLMRQGGLDEAEPLLREAGTAMPDALLPIVHLTELLEQIDRFDEAEALLDRAELIARREGRDVTAQRAALLARTPRWREGLALLDAEPALGGTAMLLRARLRDRAARHPEAWADAIAAKEHLARQRGHAYQDEAVARLFGQLRQLAARLDRLPKALTAPDVPQPIFILGFPRSGTTLTEQVLSSHSRIRPGGELPFVAELADFVARRNGIAAIAEQDAELPVLLRDLYLRRAGEFGLLDMNADFFTDKMPLNEVYLPLLRIAFPQAPLIAVGRDPRDVLVSVMQHDMTHGFHCGYRVEDAARHLAAVSDLTEAYRAAGIAPYAFGYARFVAQQEGETARLMAYLGLEAEPAQLAFHQNRRHAPTPSYAQVREPLNDRAIGRWRNYAHELAPILPLIAPAIARESY